MRCGVAGLVLVVAVGGSLAGCGGDDGASARPSSSTFRVQADAVFCDDLLSARPIVIEQVGGGDGDGAATVEQVTDFAIAYEPILRDHIAALRHLTTPRADDPGVVAIIAAAEEVADGLERAAQDPATVAGDGTGLVDLATSPELSQRLSDYGLRPC